MTNKELKKKAIKIKGKDYILVSDRVLHFNEEHEKGYIQTQLVSSDNDTWVIKAKVVPSSDNPDRYFTGYSQAVIGDGNVNKTAALENAETSAVGRALGFIGIGVIESIASADELNKAIRPNPINKTTGEIGDLGTCAKCGASNVLSKAGKPYCSKVCWKNQQKEQQKQETKELPPTEELIEDLPF